MLQRHLRNNVLKMKLNYNYDKNGIAIYR